MKSPKPATDNRFKWTHCIVTNSELDFFAVLWRPFWKWRQVDILRCRESIQDIIIYLHMKFRWNRTMLNLWGIVAVILEMATGRNFRCQESIRDIIIYLHMKCRCNRTMLNVCGIVAAILKMATGKKSSMSGINSGHHYLPKYNILMISDNVEFLPPIFYAVFWQPF